MNKGKTADRLKYIMKQLGLRQVDILKRAEPFCKKYGVQLRKNDISQYVNGKTEPGQEKLTVLGMALNVSEAWLMGFDVPMERKMPTPEDGDGRVAEFMSLFARLSEEQQKMVVAQIKGILAAE